MANTKTIKAYNGTTVILTHVGSTTSGANNWEIDYEVTSTGTDAQDANASIKGNIGGTAAFVWDQEIVLSSVEDDGAAIVTKITCEATTTADCTLDGMTVTVEN